MSTAIILLVIFLPVCLSFVFSATQKKNIKISKKTSSENFSIFIPSTVLVIGIIDILVFLALLLGFTVLSNERPHLIFYAFCGLGIWLGTYLCIKTLTFKVVVKDEIITVFTAFRKPYSFTFGEIVSAVRQVKKNQLKSERIVIKTTNKMRLIVESGEVSYKRFAKKIQSKVKKEYLTGF